MRFPPANIDNLQALGYTEAEGRFLYLVATTPAISRHANFCSSPEPKVVTRAWCFRRSFLAKITPRLVYC